MRKCLPACSLFRQDIRHHPETANYKSCRACNTVFGQHLSGGLTTLLRAKVQLSGALQGTGAVQSAIPPPPPKTASAQNFHGKKPRTIQESKMRSGADGRDYSVTMACQRNQHHPSALCAAP